MRLMLCGLGMALLGPVNGAITDFDGLSIDVPATMVATDSGPTKTWTGQVKPSEVAITQVISVIKTSIAQVETPPTPQAFLDMHDRVQRTNQNFAGQLFLTQKTTLGETPFVMVTGTLLGPGANNLVIPIYFNSAAFLTETHAYEVIWLSHSAEEYASSLKAIRALSFKSGETTSQLANLFGNAGEYTIAGAPFRLQSKAPFIPQSAVRVRDDEVGAYRANRYEDELDLVLDLRHRKSDAPEKTLVALAIEAVKQDAAYEITVVSESIEGNQFSGLLKRELAGAVVYVKVSVIQSGPFVISLMASHKEESVAAAADMKRLKSGT